MNCKYCEKEITGGGAVDIGSMQAKRGLHAHLRCALKELEELEASFDLRWKADMRAIKRWQSEDPEKRELTWPDHADMVVWLLNSLENTEKALETERLNYNELWKIYKVSGDPK